MKFEGYPRKMMFLFHFGVGYVVVSRKVLCKSGEPTAQNEIFWVFMKVNLLVLRFAKNQLFEKKSPQSSSYQMGDFNFSHMVERLRIIFNNSWSC